MVAECMFGKKTVNSKFNVLLAGGQFLSCVSKGMGDLWEGSSS